MTRGRTEAGSGGAAGTLALAEERRGAGGRTEEREARRGGRTLVDDHRWLLLLFGARHPLWVLTFAAPLGALLLARGLAAAPGPLWVAAHAALGVLYWTFVEYGIHRWLYHWRPRCRTLRRVVQSFHVAHHRDIADRAFWNAGPFLALPLAGILSLPLFALLGESGAVAMTLSGALAGYYVYEWCHFRVHERPHLGGWLGAMQRLHLHHHHVDPRACFGVSTPLWDVLLGTHAARRREGRAGRRAALAAALLLGGIAVAAPSVAADGPPALLGADVWAALPRPAERSLDGLAARIPGLDRARVREMSLEVTRALLARAAERRLSALDLFTDAGLRGDEVYLVPRAVLAEVDRAFDLGALFPISGETTDGDPFAMDAIVMGGCRVEMLYSRDELTFKHPVYRGYGGRYTLRGRVSQRIEGPGALAIEGVLGPLDVTIRGFRKLTDATVRVETSLLDQDDRLYPIRPRAPARDER